MQMVIESDVFASMIDNSTSWFNLRNIRVHTHISAYCSYWKNFIFIFMLEIKFIYFVLITFMYFKNICYFIKFKITSALTLPLASKCLGNHFYWPIHVLKNNNTFLITDFFKNLFDHKAIFNPSVRHF